MLKEHGLLVPSDYYYHNKQPYCPMPKSEQPDSHLRETIASRARNLARSSMIEKLRTPAITDIDELHKSGSELSDDARSMFTSDDEDAEVNLLIFGSNSTYLSHLKWIIQLRQTKKRSLSGKRQFVKSQEPISSWI